MPRRCLKPSKSGPKKVKVVPVLELPSPPPPSPPPPPPVLSPPKQRDLVEEMMGLEVEDSPSPEPVVQEQFRSRKSPKRRHSSAQPERSTRNETSQESSTKASNRRKTIEPKKSGKMTAMQEIAKLQQTSGVVIPKLPFARIIREILLEYCNRDLRVTVECLTCLQESAEIFGVQLMEDAYRCTVHRDRTTLMPKDMKLALMLRKDSVMF